MAAAEGSPRSPHFIRLDFAYATRSVLYVMAAIMAVAALVALRGLRRGVQQDQQDQQEEQADQAALVGQLSDGARND